MALASAEGSVAEGPGAGGGVTPFGPPVTSEVLKGLAKSPQVTLTGLPGGSKAYGILSLAAQSKRPIIVVTAVEAEADGLLADLEAWSPLLPAENRPALLLYPEHDPAGRLAALGEWTQKPWAILTCSMDALRCPTVAPEDLKAQTLELRPGQSYPRASLLERLATGGYVRSDMVEVEGDLAVRGEVVDIWPAGKLRPWRLLFDGDTLESLREINPGTQRSEAYLEPQKLLPMKESHAEGSLSDYAPHETLWFWDGVDSQLTTKNTAPHPLPLPLRHKASADAPTAQWRGGERVQGEGDSSLFAHSILYKGLPPAGAIDAGCRSTAGLASGVARAAQEAKQRKSEGGSIFFFCHNAGESERLCELLEEDLGHDGTRGMEFLLGPLRSGFWMPPSGGEKGLLVLTNAEIFNRYRHRPRLQKYQGAQALQEVRDIRIGDYAVHEHYGIGRYKGLELVNAGGQEAEFLKLEYRGGDRLFVPLADFRQIQKYSGAEGKSPRLNSLDTASWERIKARVKEGVRELAKDLLRVHASRAAMPGHAFPSDSHLEQEFAASFLFEETADQKKAIEETKRDMESSRPMDRLILGDVGYGKTEVAMRAAFKAVVDSKQVAVLAPTTILAEQHFRTFRERFADYPVRLGMLSRFQSPQEEKKMLLGVANGSLDMVIGTHRLLQKDIVFKDLGLLIIDEEHRFGVHHKELLKKMRQHIDVLTLTATPIPRTLSFAMAGMRELSVIETPPTGRLPITTHVGPYDESMVRQAVQNELAREGQVFYVHNRVQTLNSRLHFLQQLLPGISIGVVHGQMAGPAIEKAMWDFLQRKHQILLATSIIESGLDIPTVNTLVVEEAEEFGLAQLYQLRGRVGRERQKAFCYLFYSPSVPLTSDARARLEALREFTELGSAYRLAVRDMEIRGAGNLLGSEQHGFIAAVGLDLYSNLLQEEIARLKGQPPPKESRFPTLDLSVHAFFPVDYLPSEELRIIFYKKLIATESSQNLEALRTELEDRFGPLPLEAVTLLEISALRIQARDLGIEGVIQKPSALEIRFLPNTKVLPETLVHLGQDVVAIRFRPGPPFTLQIKPIAFEGNGPVAYLKDIIRSLNPVK